MPLRPLPGRTLLGLLVAIALLATANPSDAAAPPRKGRVVKRKALKPAATRPTRTKARAARGRAVKKPLALPLGAVQRTLKNGLRVIVVPTPGLKNVVTLQIPVQVGSRNEVEAGKSGFAHFFEHMKFRGTKKWPTEKAEELLTRLGVQGNAYTSNDITNYYNTFLKPDLETMIAFEADNFQNLAYDEQSFKDEAGAISGEARQRFSPGRALFGAMNEAAFTTHPYNHPVIGTPQDIANMPTLYKYSKKFFRRHYRPDRMTLVISGDVDPEKTIGLVKKHWGNWNPARPAIPTVPKEPPLKGPVYRHVPWKGSAPTQLQVAVRAPAFSDRNVGHAALQLAFEVATGPTSAVYRKLVIDERKVTDLGAYTPESVDPGLFTVITELVDPADAVYVRDEIMKALAAVTAETPSRATLDAIKSRRRYALENSWDNAEEIGASVAGFAHHNRSFGTLDRFSARVQEITPEQVRRAARKYIRDQGLVIGSVSQKPLAKGMETIPSFASLRAAVRPSPAAPSRAIARAAAATQVSAARARRIGAHRLGGKNRVSIKTDVSAVNVELRFDVSSLADPPGKEGLAYLAASMLTDAGSRAQKIEDIIAEIYPTSGDFGTTRSSTSTSVVGKVPRAQFQKFVDAILPMVTDPGFRAEDFERLKQEQIKDIEDIRSNATTLAVSRARGSLYGATRLATPELGTVKSVKAITLADVKEFVRSAYTRDVLRIGVAGKVDAKMVDYLESSLARLPARAKTPRKSAVPKARRGTGRNRVEIVEKSDAAGTSLAIARPIDLEVTDPDLAALLVATNALGGGSGRVFNAIRGRRGLSYGAYANVRGGVGGAFTLYSQPVPDESAGMAARIALYELDQLVQNGLTASEFEARKEELLRNLLAQSSTQGPQLSSLLAGESLGVGDLNNELRGRIEKLTLADVNRAVQTHLSGDWSMVVVTKDAAVAKKQLLAARPGAIKYDSPKPKAILEQDAAIAARPLDIRAADVRVTKADSVYAR